MSSTLMVHFPLLTLTAVLSRGKWNSGRKTSVGTSSVAGSLQSSVKVNTALRRSKPDEVTLPTVAIGVGLTYASAARNPGVLPISEGVLDLSDVMDGVASCFLSVSGKMGD